MPVTPVVNFLMRTGNRFFPFLFWVAFGLILATGGVGCGSGGKLPERFGPPAPASFGRDEYRPNYGGDMHGTNYYSNPTITYRFPVPSSATDIHLNLLASQMPTPKQVQEVKGAVKQWQEALTGVGKPYARRFVEVAPSDLSADIDFVVQSPFQFGGESEEWGSANYLLADRTTGEIERSVVRLRGDLSERRFRWATVHETGHALGMAGHSRAISDIMAPTPRTDSPTIELSRRDKNTVRAMYDRSDSK